MDYSMYHEFPFPGNLNQADQALKERFLSLPDEQQLELLSGCISYEQFHSRVSSRLPTL